MSETKNRSFWTTLPGILTGVAAVLAALGGLIGGLAAAGIIGGGEPPPVEPIPSEVSSVTIQGETMLEVGTGTVFTATVRDSAGNTLSDQIITWTSNNPSVAVVSPEGKVAVKSVGTAVIEASVNGSSDTVVVTVQKAVSSARVPKLMGLTAAEAASSLEEAGLNVGSTMEDFSASDKAGLVLSSDPAEGTSVQKGSTVDLVISKGPEMVTVPRIMGLTAAEAASSLEEAGLNVGSTMEDFSASVKAGLALSSDPAEGANVQKGSTVNLIISAGPLPEVSLLDPVVDGRSITISWHPMPSVEGVLVLRSEKEITDRPTPGTQYRHADQIGGATVAYVGGDDEFKFTDEGLAILTRYYYSVFTYDQNLKYSSAVMCVAKTTWDRNDIFSHGYFGGVGGYHVEDCNADDVGSIVNISRIKVIHHPGYLVRSLDTWLRLDDGNEKYGGMHGDQNWGDRRCGGEGIDSCIEENIFFEPPNRDPIYIIYVKVEVAQNPDGWWIVTRLEFRTDAPDSNGRNTWTFGLPARGYYDGYGWPIKIVEFNDIILLGLNSYGHDYVGWARWDGTIAGLKLWLVCREGTCAPMVEELP